MAPPKAEVGAEFDAEVEVDAEVARSKAVVAIPLVADLLEDLSEFDLSFLPAGRGDETFASAMADADGVLVSSGVVIDRAVIDASPRLRVISTMSVGFDHIDLVAAQERGIVVTITPVLSDAVADLTLMLMAMLARRIPEAMSAVRTGGWHGLRLGADLAGKTLLLVGFGRIGQTVAVRALAAKMRVVYFDTRSDVQNSTGAVRVDELGEGLAGADFVSLHVDLNAGTRGFFGAPEIAMMKPTAFFVNTSRGGVVDQPALTKALVEGSIAGAALDVLEVEPPDPDEPLLTAPNVILLPHIGSATTETRAAMARCAVDNLVKVLRGEDCQYALP
jgi:lactate dehydrogenase-like 2-hydroxyacid dehydrogenase